MRILYATDGSGGAHAAGDFLRGLSLTRDSCIHIVTVSDAPDREALLRTAREQLAWLPVSLTTEVLSGHLTGSVVEAVLCAGEAMAADLIVLGAIGCSAIARFFVGSVAEGIARHAHCPVLMVRAGAEAGLSVAVIGVDSSERTRDTVLWAANLFPFPPACELHLVAVVPAQTWTTFSVSSETDPVNPTPAHETVRVQTLEEERRRAESWMASLTHEARKNASGGETARWVTAEVRQGNRVDELIQAAEETGAELIIVGTKERTALERFFISSVSERVLRHAGCSVLIYRTQSGIAGAEGAMAQ